MVSADQSPGAGSAASGPVVWWLLTGGGVSSRWTAGAECGAVESSVAAGAAGWAGRLPLGVRRGGRAGGVVAARWSPLGPSGLDGEEEEEESSADQALEAGSLLAGPEAWLVLAGDSGAGGGAAGRCVAAGGPLGSGGLVLLEMRRGAGVGGRAAGGSCRRGSLWFSSAILATSSAWAWFRLSVLSLRPRFLLAQEAAISKGPSHSWEGKPQIFWASCSILSV